MLLFLLSLTIPLAAVAKDADPDPLWEMRLEQDRLEAELAKQEKEMERLLAEKELLRAEAREVRNQKKLTATGVKEWTPKYVEYYGLEIKYLPKDEAGCMLFASQPLHERQEYGQTQLDELCVAASVGYAVCVQKLLGNGASVNNRTSNGHTALMIAAAGGHTDIVQLLLDHGGDASVKVQGHTAETLAALMGYQDTALLLKEHAYQVEVFHFLKLAALLVVALSVAYSQLGTTGIMELVKQLEGLIPGWKAKPSRPAGLRKKRR